MHFGRREPRLETNLAVTLWGIGAEGMPFSQEVVARNLSGQGALLSGVDQEVRCGDFVLIQYREKRARFRVVWVRKSDNGDKNRVAVQRLRSEECPWPDVLLQNHIVIAPDVQEEQPAPEYATSR